MSGAIPGLPGAATATVDYAARLDRSTWLTRPRFAVALGMILLAVFPQVILGTQSFVFRDFGIFGYPVAAYHKECFWRGEMPLWNPLNGCGIPFLAQWNTLTLYPLSLIYLLLPLPWSLNLFCVLHLWLGGIGMFCLATRWTNCCLAGAVAGVAFPLSGVAISSLMWPTHMAVLAWMPWVLVLVQRAWTEGGRMLWIATLVGATQMLGGTPELILFTWLCIAGLWIVDHPTWIGFRRLATITSLVTAVSAAQLLPFFELLGQSRRDAMFATNIWALPSWGWASLFVPLLNCYRSPQGVFFQPGQDVYSSYYLGITMLGLAGYAIVSTRDRRIWLLASAAGIGFWLAFGDAAGAYKLLVQLFPPLKFMRYPAKFVVLTAFALPILAAFATAKWLDPVSNRKQTRLLVSSFAVCLLVTAGILLFGRDVRLNADWSIVCSNGLWRLFFLIAACCALFAIKRSVDNPRSQAAWTGAFLTLLILDLLTHVPDQNPTASPTVFTAGALASKFKVPPPDQGRALPARATHDLFYYSMLPDSFQDALGRRLGLFGNYNLIDGISSPDGFYSIYLQPQREVWEKVFFAPTNQFPQGLADFLAVAHTTSPSDPLRWIVRSNALSIISAGQEARFASPASILNHLTQPNLEPRQMVYLPNEAQTYIAATNRTDARILNQKSRAHEITFNVEASQSSLVVLSQAYYKPWRAYIDGVSTRIWRANHAFQALEVPAGRHSVRLVYEDRAFRFGAMISFAGVALCLLGLWRNRKQPIGAMGRGVSSQC